MGFSATISNYYHAAQPYLNSYVYPAGEGLNVGDHLVDNRFKERTVRQGRNKMMTIGYQIPQLYYGWSQCARALGSAVPSLSGAQVPFGIVPIASVVIPAAIALAADRKIENLVLRKMVNFLHDHIGTMCQIAVVISSIALCVFGNPILGGISLACVSVGILDEYGLLPEKMRRILHKTWMPVGIVTGLVVGDWFMKAIAVAQIVVVVAKKVMEWHSKRVVAELKKKARQKGQPSDVIRKVSIADLKNLDKKKLKINKDHLDIITSPKIPPVDLQELVSLFDQVNWTDHRKAVLVALSNEPRWLEVGYDPNNEISYLKGQIRTMVDKIKNKKIRAGEPVDYKALQNWGKYITYKLRGKLKEFNDSKIDLMRNNQIDFDKVLYEDVEKACALAMIQIAEQGDLYQGPIDQVEKALDHISWIKYTPDPAALKQSLERIVRRQNEKGALVSESSDFLRPIKVFHQFRACRSIGIECADAFIRMATEGGDNCGPGIYQSLKRLYAGFVEQTEDIPIQSRVLFWLENKRNRIFEGIYDKMMNGEILNTLLGALFNMSDVHSYNQMVNMYANEEFGLHDECAKNDASAVMEPLNQVVISKLFSDTRRAFWDGVKPKKKVCLKRLNTPEAKKARFFEIWKKMRLEEKRKEQKGYNVTTIVSDLKESLAFHQFLLTQEDVFKWWQGWIGRQNLPVSEKDHAIAKLTEELTLFGEPLLESYSKNGKNTVTIKDKFLKGMLIEMGVFA